MFPFSKSKKVKRKITTLAEAIQRIEELEQGLESTAARIKELEAKTSFYFQKFHLIRYNSVGGMGGDQSFSLALLDKENNGFILSSLFMDESARAFIKPIKRGTSQYQLSEEEQQVLDRVIKK